MDCIPEEPKIPIRNYLVELVERENENWNGIYIRNIENVIKKIWTEIVESKGRQLYVRKLFPERFGISSSTFYHYKNGKRSISIQMLEKLLLFWQESCNKSSEEVEKKWDKIFESDLVFGTKSLRQKITLPQFFTPKLAYLAGWICGDGSLNRQHNYVLKISEKSKSQLELILKPLLNQIFNVEAPIFQKSPGGYAIQIGSKPIYMFLTRILRIEVGKIPKFIEDMTCKLKSYYLAGFFDADGYVNPSYLNSKIEILQSNQNMLKGLIELFADLNITFNEPRMRENDKGKWYYIQLRKKSEILKFASRIPSHHIDKFQRLKALEAKIEKNWSQYSPTSRG